jgi:mannosyltransferase OCH1-like enzyme
MIPEIIHKVIIIDDGEIPLLPEPMKEAMNTFKEKNPEYEHKLYSGKDCEKYIKKHFDEKILKTYLKLKPFAYRADLFRYLVLYNEGGWYSDSKQVCFESLDVLNNTNKEFIVSLDASINPNCLFNGFFGSVPKHPILKKCIDMIVFNVEHEHYGLDCLYPTGPGLFMQCAVDYLRKYPEKCLIGRHIIDNQKQSFICFDKQVFIKHKYNSPPEGGIYSDIPGGNNYGEMWRNWDIYN